MSDTTSDRRRGMKKAMPLVVNGHQYHVTSFGDFVEQVGGVINQFGLSDKVLVLSREFGAKPGEATLELVDSSELPSIAANKMLAAFPCGFKADTT